MFSKSIPSLAKKCLLQERGGLLRLACFTMQQQPTMSLMESIGETIEHVRYRYFKNPNTHLNDDKWAKLIVVEGNIGVGKDDFAQKLAKKIDLRFFPNADTNYDLTRTYEHGMPREKVEWNINPLSAQQRHRPLSFEYFCDNPKDWVHTGFYQIMMVRARNLQYMDALGYLLHTGRGCCMVRHFQFDPVFARAQKNMGWIGNRVWEQYDRNYERGNTVILPPQVVIYLDVPAQLAYNNIQSVGSEAEKKLPLDYFKRIEEAYKMVYIPYAREEGVNVIELDWDPPRDFDEVFDELDGMETLSTKYNKWINYGDQLNRIKRMCYNMNFRHSRFDFYNPIEEMWVPHWVEDLMETECRNSPFYHQRGFNKQLGDKWIMFKDV